jgi:multiple sugar transport system substrate-binding protein
MATDDSTTPPETPETPTEGRPSGLRAWWTAGREAAGRLVRRRPGWTGFTAGLLVGALLASLVVVYGLPRFEARGWESGNLVLLSGRDDSVGGQRQVLIAEWNQLHPDHRVRIEEVPSTADGERSEMLARARGDGGAVDVLNLDVAWLPEFAEAKLIRELSDAGVDRSSFLPGPLETCEYSGGLWGLPFNTDAGLLYRRDDLVRAAPDSWGTLQSDVDRVLYTPAKSPANPVAGLVTQLADYEGLTVNALEAVWSAGGEIVDDHGDVQVDSPAAKEGLQRLVDGVRPARVQRILPLSLTLTEIPSTTAFRDGQALFLRNWPVAYGTLSAPAEPGTAGAPTAAPKFAVSPLPWPSVLGGQNLAIADRSAHPRAARALIDFLTDPRSQQILFERGGFAATRKVVYDDPVVLARYPYAGALRTAVENARLRPRSPHYALFSEVLRDAVYSMLITGAGPPANLADRLRAALRGQRE